MSKQNPNYKPKLSIELTEEQQIGLQQIKLPHGFMRGLFSVLIDDILALNETKGPQALALIISGIVRPSDVLPSIVATDKFYPKDNKEEHY